MNAKNSILLLGALLAGCAGTTPQLGGAPTVATGAAAGSSKTNASMLLERCDRPLGTLSVVEDRAAPWYQYLSQYKLGSTVPVLRKLIQQSNCFVIVERGAAMQNVMAERELMATGEMRASSHFGKGQMVAADYTVSPTITFSQKGTQGVGGALGGFGLIGAVAGIVAGGFKANEASTTLLMIDNRSGVQLAAAEGSAKNVDFSLFGAAWAGGAVGGGGWSNTPEGKILVAAFMDSYNQLVRAVREYKAQEVAGGLGTGGTLAVQGTAPAPATDAPKTKPARKK